MDNLKAKIKITKMWAYVISYSKFGKIREKEKKTFLELAKGFWRVKRLYEITNPDSFLKKKLTKSITKFKKFRMTIGGFTANATPRLD